MELKEFIAESLRQVIEGVKAAQSGEDGQLINAQVVGGTEFGGQLVNVGTFGVISRVEFDVQVSAETSGSGGVKLVVFGVGGEGGAQHKAATANRVSFSVPVRLPDGDPTRRDEYLAKRKESAAKVHLSRPIRMK